MFPDKIIIPNKTFTIEKVEPFGFYRVNPLPNEGELKTYYEEKYYQENKGNYSGLDLEWLEAKSRFRRLVCESFASDTKYSSVLDVGCGQGFLLKHFLSKGYSVGGIDYSSSGIERHNPELLPHVQFGDIYDILSATTTKYDIVVLDNVLEHAHSPENLLGLCRGVLADGGLLVVEVPNDFSVLQEDLIERKLVDRHYWVAHPDHLYYFGQKSLVQFVESIPGLSLEVMVSDFPIDMALYNSDTNFITEKTRGKEAHKARMLAETSILKKPFELALNYYKSLSELGLGRNISGYFRKQ